MPTDNDQLNHEEEGSPALSALLRQATPPLSPKHLDAAILSHAKTQAAMLKEDNSNARKWYSQRWTQAAVAFSMVGIALSIGINAPVEERFEGEAELSAKIGGDSPVLTSADATASSIAATATPIQLETRAQIEVDLAGVSATDVQASIAAPAILEQARSNVADVQTSAAPSALRQADSDPGTAAAPARRNLSARSAIDQPAPAIEFAAEPSIASQAQIRTQDLQPTAANGVSEETAVATQTAPLLSSSAFSFSEPQADSSQLKQASEANANTNNRLLLIDFLEQVLVIDIDVDVDVDNNRNQTRAAKISAAASTAVSTAILATTSSSPASRRAALQTLLRQSSDTPAQELRYSELRESFTAYELPQSLIEAMEALALLEL